MSVRRLLARLPLLAQSFIETRGIGPLAIVITFLVIAWHIVRKADEMQDFGLDAHAYWAVNVADPYRLPAGTPDAFLYSPPFVYVFGILSASVAPLPCTLARVTLAALLWLAQEWTLPMLALPPVFNEVFFGISICSSLWVRYRPAPTSRLGIRPLEQGHTRGRCGLVCGTR